MLSSNDLILNNKNVLSIDLGQRSYPVSVQPVGFDEKLLNDLINDRKVVVVTNKTVADLYERSLIDTVSARNVSVVRLPDGEKYKNIGTWNNILDHLASCGFNRSDVIVALGGGVVCDMAGFAAACWMRGVDVIQIPTTLLAQVDASVGGKTGINHEAGKNLIGAFYQPQAVIINVEVLNTLPDREYVSGLAECIKYGLIDQPVFLNWLKANKVRINNRDNATVSKMVLQCCQFKATIVAADEKEKGCRALLNLGHTFGHAIETITGYETYLHGEAVAIGMVMAAALSENLNYATAGLRDQVSELLSGFGLPVKLPAQYSAKELVKLMRLDKKVLNRSHRLILMKSLGKAVVVDSVVESAIEEAVIACIG